MKLITHNTVVLIVVSALTSVLSILVYHNLVTGPAVTQDDKQRAMAVAEREFLLSDRIRAAFSSSVPTDFISAAESGKKAVVFIRAGVGTVQQKSGATQSSGSGVLISHDGYIITNQHVVSNVSNVEVILNDNRVYNARVIGSDSGTDLALLKIEASGLDFLIFGDSDSLRVGEWVMAVGNPFRLQSTVTAGIVSARARNLDLFGNQGIESFIQTDAAVNPGNSGGALINTRGDLVGICTAILSESGSYEGFSFAIPANLAKKVAYDLMEFGVVQRGWLGVEIEKVTAQISENAGMADVYGVYITSVSKGGGAWDAGVKAEDIIIAVDEKKVGSPAEFMEITGRKRPGDKVSITLMRDGRKQTLVATLRNHLNSTDPVGIMDSPVFREIGLEIRNLDRYEKSLISDVGVMVVSVRLGSLTANTKMEPGYIITRINNREVSSAGMLKATLEQNRGKTIVMEGFYPKYPGEYPYTFVMP